MILRCEAPRKHSGRKCGGFVARVPDGSRFVGLLAHSDLTTDENHIVAPCRDCGFLHQIAPPAWMLAALRKAA